MESSSLLLCKGLLLTGEASLGVVWGGTLAGRDPGSRLCFRLRGEDTGSDPGCSGGCSQGARSVQRGGILYIYLKLVTSAHRVHGCALTVGVLTGVAMVMGICSLPEIAQSMVHRGPQMPWSDAGSSGALGWGSGP